MVAAGIAVWGCLAVTLVNSLGGKIDIYNEDIGGAAIHITIPREKLTS